MKKIPKQESEILFKQIKESLSKIDIEAEKEKVKNAIDRNKTDYEAEFESVKHVLAGTHCYVPRNFDDFFKWYAFEKHRHLNWNNLPSITEDDFWDYDKYRKKEREKKSNIPNVKWQDLIKKGKVGEVEEKWARLKDSGAKKTRAAAFIFLLAVNNYLLFEQEEGASWKRKKLCEFAKVFYGESLETQFWQKKPETKEDVEYIRKRFNEIK